MNIPEKLFGILTAIRAAGGRPLLIGGCVRDHLLKRPTKDFDVEVFGLQLDQLEVVLSAFGQVDAVGKAFGVFKLAGIEADFSVPRRDNKIGVGHRGFDVVVDPSMSIEDAARRRDLTINSISYDPFSQEFIDPFYGRKALGMGMLQATDPDTFLEDPLRALRVAQFISRLRFAPSNTLENLCRKADLSELPGERLYVEFCKLLKGEEPGLGLEFLYHTDMVRFFPELAALHGCQQDPQWHPEGPVDTHTILAVEAARRETDDLTVLFTVLLHDAGKPSTTKLEDGRIRARGHEEAGEAPTRSFLERLRAPNDLIERVVALVVRHLAPAHFHNSKAGPGAYRRLARFLASKGTDMQTLYLVSRADHLGRTTSDALAGKFEAGDEFLAAVDRLGVRTLEQEQTKNADVVRGQHLIDRGLQPGPEFGKILAKCREIQFDLGLTEPEAILGRVL